ncbi:MAG TPA: FecR domain-containing protein [Parasegetibacter sp.]
MPSNTEIQQLVEKYLNDEMTTAEISTFRDYINDDNYRDIIARIFESAMLQKRYSGRSGYDHDLLFQELMGKAGTSGDIQERSKATSVRKLHWWQAAAAVLVLAAGIGFWKYQSNLTASGSDIHYTESTVNDLLPGKEGAILKLADGSEMVLDDLGEGVIIHKGGAQVVLKNGKLVYEELSGEATENAAAYHTMYVPRGRQFHLVLPDGSEVWLNAASSITYPIVFKGDERRISLTGEAYFEVKHDPAKPFIVSKGNMHVNVLGTHFNVNAYDEEKDIKVTLLEGSVKVVLVDVSTEMNNRADAEAGNPVKTKSASAENFYTLSPGHQLIVRGNSLIPNRNANIDQVMAWKNGIFDFEEMAFDEVMRQLSRWYNLEVDYENKIPDITFGGRMGRDVNLSKVLEFLQKAGVHFKLDEKNRRLTVTN